MPSKSSLTIEQVLTLLADTPRRIAALTDGVGPAQLQTPISPGEWSVNDILAHLRACADVWGDCIRVIAIQDRPTIRAINPTTWIEQTDYREQKFNPSLQAFTVQRADLLKYIGSLAPKDWSRTATVTGAGSVLTRTVLFYAQWLARHERSHIKLLERKFKAMHK